MPIDYTIDLTGKVNLPKINGMPTMTWQEMTDIEIKLKYLRHVCMSEYLVVTNQR